MYVSRPLLLITGERYAHEGVEQVSAVVQRAYEMSVEDVLSFDAVVDADIEEQERLVA